MTVSAVLAFLALIGVPLMVIIGVVTAVVWIVHGDGAVTDFSGLVRLISPIEGLITKDEFLAIPLFMASGAIMTKGGLAQRLVDVMNAALGWLPGGLAISAIAACMFFAAISGSSPVTLIAVGSIMVPAMVRERYPENFALGIVMTGGSLGAIVPPAISVLIYSISVSSVKGSVESNDLYAAGAVPALFIAGMLAIYSVFIGLRVRKAQRAAGDVVPRLDAGRLGAALKRGVWALLMPALIIGGIFGGLFTPSRAGAVAAIYALCITMFVYRELDLKGVLKALAEAGKLMGMLILIIGLAFALNEFLADIQVDEILKQLVVEWDLGPVAFMLLVNAILIILGALMDSISATLIFAPMLAPIAVGHYGIDPLHFGVVFLVNMEIGYLMPPVATNLFVAAATFKRSFAQVSRAVLPTLGLTVVSLIVFIYVPTCSKGLVNLRRDGTPRYGDVAFWEDFPWDGPSAASTTGPGTDDDGLQGIMQKHMEEGGEEPETETETAPTSTPDAGAEVDPMDQYKQDQDDMGIGGEEPKATAPSAPDAGAAEEVDPMDKYKKNADDMGIE